MTSEAVFLQASRVEPDVPSDKSKSIENRVADWPACRGKTLPNKTSNWPKLPTSSIGLFDNKLNFLVPGEA